MPCHTLLAGDTLFVAGCGKFFEGTPEEMYRALIEILGSLDPETVRNFCASKLTCQKLLQAQENCLPNNAVVRWEHLSCTEGMHAYCL